MDSEFAPYIYKRQAKRLSFYRDTSSGMRMQRQQPHEQGQTCRGNNQPPWRRTFLKPQIRQVATKNLCASGQCVKAQCLDRCHKFECLW